MKKVPELRYAHSICFCPFEDGGATNFTGDTVELKGPNSC